MQDYDWPGNIRELENTIERAFFLSEGKMLQEENIYFQKESSSSHTLQQWIHENKTLFDLEKAYILQTLQEYEGNRSQAAKALGIGRKTLYNKLAQYEEIN